MFKEYEKECENAKKICYFNFYKYDKETRERMYYDAKFLSENISDKTKDYVIQEIANILTNEKEVEVKDDIVKYALFNLYKDVLERFSKYVSASPGEISDATIAIQNTAYKYDYKKQINAFGFELNMFGERVVYDLHPMTRNNYYWNYIEQAYGNRNILSNSDEDYLIVNYTGSDLNFLSKNYSLYEYGKEK